MSQATDGHMLVPGDPDQWWNMPVLPSAPFDGANTQIEQSDHVEAQALLPLDHEAVRRWLTAITETGGPPPWAARKGETRWSTAIDPDVETAVSQALAAMWRSSSARAEEAAGTGEQPEVQRHIDIVIDGLAKRDKSIVSDRDKPRLRKALDDADKPLAGRPGADAGVGRAIGTGWSGLSTEQRS